MATRLAAPCAIAERTSPSTIKPTSPRSFKTESNVSTLALGAETPGLLYVRSNYLTLEAYLHGNYLSGAVEETVNVDLYSTVGAVAYWYTPGSPGWAGRFFLEVSSVQADNLNGYNIGIGFTAEF